MEDEAVTVAVEVAEGGNSTTSCVWINSLVSVVKPTGAPNAFRNVTVAPFARVAALSRLKNTKRVTL